MIYGRDYSAPSPDGCTCGTCGTEVRDTPEAVAVCAEFGCLKAISDCCIKSGDAQRCEMCGELHCTSHLSKTDCGRLCDYCKGEYVAVSLKGMA